MTQRLIIWLFALALPACGGESVRVVGNVWDGATVRLRDGHGEDYHITLTTHYRP